MEDAYVQTLTMISATLAGSFAILSAIVLYKMQAISGNELPPLKEAAERKLALIQRIGGEQREEVSQARWDDWKDAKTAADRKNGELISLRKWPGWSLALTMTTIVLCLFLWPLKPMIGKWATVTLWIVWAMASITIFTYVVLVLKATK